MTNPKFVIHSVMPKATASTVNFTTFPNDICMFNLVPTKLRISISRRVISAIKKASHQISCLLSYYLSIIHFTNINKFRVYHFLNKKEWKKDFDGYWASNNNWIHLKKDLWFDNIYWSSPLTFVFAYVIVYKHKNRLWILICGCVLLSFLMVDFWVQK